MSDTKPTSTYNNAWLFKESQRFTQWWLWLIVIVCIAALVFGVYHAGAFNSSNDNGPGRDTSSALGLVAVVIVITLLVAMRLDVNINEIGIYYRFFPLQQKFKQYEWSDVERAYIIPYHPIRDYGGWGIRYGMRAKGWAYSVAGKNGLLLELKNNQRLLIGTQRLEDMQRVLDLLQRRDVVNTTKA